jgi:hypothetical protein
MTNQVLGRIQELAAEEHRLFDHPRLTQSDRDRLAKINPNEAHVRPPEIVENYEQ